MEYEFEPVIIDDATFDVIYLAAMSRSEEPDLIYISRKTSLFSDEIAYTVNYVGFGQLGYLNDFDAMQVETLFGGRDSIYLSKCVLYSWPHRMKMTATSEYEGTVFEFGD